MSNNSRLNIRAWGSKLWMATKSIFAPKLHEPLLYIYFMDGIKWKGTNSPQSHFNMGGGGTMCPHPYLLLWPPTLLRVRSLSKCIYVKFRYSRSIIWWEKCVILICTTFFEYLHLECQEFYFGHPLFSYTKMVVNINSRPIFHHKSDKLYLNLTYIYFERDLNRVEIPLRTTTLLIFSL